MLFVYLKYGKDNFPFLLNDMDKEIEVMDETLSPETAVSLSARVKDSLLSHQYRKDTADRAKLFVEEMVMTIIERNKKAKKPILAELSLFYEPDSVMIVERDSGELFDITASDIDVKGLSGFILNRLMNEHDDKAYLLTTGYNRNMIRFYRDRDKEAEDD